MARRDFGAGAADFLTDARGNVQSGGVGTVWLDQEKETQVTDLLDADGTPISTVYAKASPKGMIQFQGPPDGTGVVWVDFGGGPVRMDAEPVASGDTGVDSVNGETGEVELTAADIPFTPTGTVSATDVQAAIAEVASEGGGGGGGGSSTMTANPQTADYTLVLDDAGKVIEMTSASAINLTVPPNSSVAFDSGTIINVYQGGAGMVALVAGVGVTIRNNAPLAGQYAEASLRKRGTDEWVLAGGLSGTNNLILKDYASVTRTAGSVSLISTTPAAVHTALDLTIAAAEGDLIEYNINGLLAAAALTCQFDVYTMPSGSTVNPFGVGLDAGTLLQGVSGWQHTSNTLGHLTGSVTRVMTADDVDAGLTTLRLLYLRDTSTGRTLFATTGIPLKVWAKNYGPA